jgi:8-oxo-dGTP pyrophosphatase MutT (NUDIX family)/GNAT superfamily N-acetyltransferase
MDQVCVRRPPIDAREAESIEAFRLAIGSLSEPCSESADPTHVTASAIVVGPEGLLLHRHKRLGIWLQPGGHIDPGEAPADAAVRETLEETGVQAHHFAVVPLLVHVDVHPGPKGHTHLDLRYLLWGSGTPRPGVGESPDVRWFSWSEAKQLDEPGIAMCIAALTSPVIRPSVPSDVAAVAEVYLRSFKWAHSEGHVRSPHTDDEVRVWVQENLLVNNHVTVAIAAGIPIAFVALDHSAARLNHLYVDPAWTNRGIGSALFQEAVRMMPNGFELWTFQENDRAKQFCERNGCVAVESTDGLGNEEQQPDVRYEWSG